MLTMVFVGCFVFYFIGYCLFCLGAYSYLWDKWFMNVTKGVLKQPIALVGSSCKCFVIVSLIELRDPFMDLKFLQKLKKSKCLFHHSVTYFKHFLLQVVIQCFSSSTRVKNYGSRKLSMDLLMMIQLLLVTIHLFFVANCNI